LFVSFFFALKDEFQVINNRSSLLEVQHERDSMQINGQVLSCCILEQSI